MNLDGQGPGSVDASLISCSSVLDLWVELAGKYFVAKYINLKMKNTKWYIEYIGRTKYPFL